jgi:hypothetical protein
VSAAERGDTGAVAKPAQSQHSAFAAGQRPAEPPAADSDTGLRDRSKDAARAITPILAYPEVLR